MCRGREGGLKRPGGHLRLLPGALNPGLDSDGGNATSKVELASATETKAPLRGQVSWLSGGRTERNTRRLSVIPAIGNR